jgi:hypothetical protein
MVLELRILESGDEPFVDYDEFIAKWGNSY